MALKKKINLYHYVMLTLYSKVTYVFTIFFIVILYIQLYCRDENDRGDPGVLIKGNALAVLDFDGLD